MASEVNSEASEAALMVYATLSNPAKADANLAKQEAAKPNERHMDRIREEGSDDGRSERSDKSDRSDRSDRSNRSNRSERSQRSNRSDRHSEHDRDRYKSDDNASDVSDNSLRGEPNITNEGQNTSHIDELISKATSERDLESEILEKQSLLLDLQRLKLQGIQLSKEWTINDRIEDLTLEIRRHTLHMDEMANVQTMRDGLRFVCTGVEMLNNRIGLLDLDGWSTEVCRDLGKHDANLSRIYRKYWRRTGSTSPELDIAASLVASMGMFHFKQKMSKKIYDSRGPRRAAASNVRPKTPIDEDDDDDEDEGVPP